MHSVTAPEDLPGFRSIARGLLAQDIVPEDVDWTGQAGLFGGPAPAVDAPAPSVPRAFVDLAESIACHRDTIRWPLLYQALWRLSHGEKFLLDQPADPLMHRLHRMAAAVRRDRHRMTAFVRFRHMPDETYVAWYEPQHHVLRLTAPFFVDRFAAMRFSILMPELCLHWDKAEVRFTPGVSAPNAATDCMEAWWQRYYAATFNPARANPALMARHMPRRFWANMPEAGQIGQLIAEAGGRTRRMIEPD